MQHISHWNDQILKPIQYGGHTNTGMIAFKKLQTLLERMMLRRTKVERADDMGLPPRVVMVRKDYFTEEEEEVRILLLPEALHDLRFCSMCSFINLFSKTFNENSTPSQKLVHYSTTIRISSPSSLECDKWLIIPILC